MIVYWALRLAGIARFLPLRVCYILGDIAATCMWWGWRSKRVIAIETMTRVLGDSPAARRTARYSFLNYGRYLVDFVRAPALRPEEVLAKVHFDRWDEIDAAFREGKGVIFILMHYGNWDMGGAVLAARGYAVNVIADDWGNDRANEVVVRARQWRGMTVIPARRAVGGITRAMRRGEALAILIDIPVAQGEGVQVEMFGEPLELPAGPARIALRTGARVIPVALPRASGTSDQIIGMADLDVRVEKTGDEARDVQTLTRRIVAAHERFIRAYPDQWYNFRRLWPVAEDATVRDPEPAFASER